MGLNGAQGTGKTTTALFLEALLGEAGLRCCTLSLDDFYLGRAQRLKLARDVHPLLQTRGVPGTHDVIILEGWCIGCPPQGEAALAIPCNTLERVEDPDQVWREYVNYELSTRYAALFERLDLLLMLQAPDMETILQWRQLQEQKLAQRSAGRD